MVLLVLVLGYTKKYLILYKPYKHSTSITPPCHWLYITTILKCKKLNPINNTC